MSTVYYNLPAFARKEARPSKFLRFGRHGARSPGLSRTCASHGVFLSHRKSGGISCEIKKGKAITGFPMHTPEGIRTPDPRLRRPLLYPTELLTHIIPPARLPEMYFRNQGQTLIMNAPADLDVSAGASRGDKIRTCDLPVPNRTLYQTEPRPETHCELLSRALE